VFAGSAVAGGELAISATSCPKYDIWRLSNLMLKRHHKKALGQSATRADELAAGAITLAPDCQSRHPAHK
jgi:hypothetical protein